MIQITTLLVMATFYAAYFLKAIQQRKEGVNTMMLGKGNNIRAFGEEYIVYLSIRHQRHDGNLLRRTHLRRCGFIPTGETAIDENLHSGENRPMRVMRLVIMNAITFD